MAGYSKLCFENSVGLIERIQYLDLTNFIVMPHRNVMLYKCLDNLKPNHWPNKSFC